MQRLFFPLAFLLAATSVVQAVPLHLRSFEHDVLFGECKDNVQKGVVGQCFLCAGKTSDFFAGKKPCYWCEATGICSTHSERACASTWTTQCDTLIDIAKVREELWKVLLLKDAQRMTKIEIDGQQFDNDVAGVKTKFDQSNESYQLLLWGILSQDVVAQFVTPIIVEAVQNGLNCHADGEVRSFVLNQESATHTASITCQNTADDASDPKKFILSVTAEKKTESNDQVTITAKKTQANGDESAVQSAHAFPKGETIDSLLSVNRQLQQWWKRTD